MAALILGNGLRDKGRLVLFLVQESEHLCWKSHINENTILAGDRCWNPFSTVSRIPHTFSLFVLPSCHFLLWKSRKKSLQLVLTPPDTFLPCYTVFSVYSRILVRKYIFCWLMGHHCAIYCRVAHHFWFLQQVDGFQLVCVVYFGAPSLKTCFAALINQLVNAMLA